MVYFKEEQRFNQPWMWVLIISVDILILGIVLNSKEQEMLMAVVLGILPVFLINWLILSVRLQVEIKDQTIYYRLTPFQVNWRKIRKHEIDHYEVIKYNPIKDYGGWGYRINFNREKALNIRGNRGLKIKYSNGKSLLLGTQQPEKMAATMQEMMDKKEDGYG